MSAPAARAGEGRLANVAAALLVGGASTRMGRDKAALEVAGEALATRTGRLLADLFEEVLIVGAVPPPGTPGRTVADPGGPDAPRCALRGLVGALEAATRERVLVVATDMPLVSADLLLALTVWPEHDAVVPRSDGRAHPLCAIYRRGPALALARERLASGELALRGLLEGLDTAWLEGADLAAVDGPLALTNVNTPEEFERVVAANPPSRSAG